MGGFLESDVEDTALEWLRDVGWSVRNGAEMIPGQPGGERPDYGLVVLEGRLRDAIARLNPGLPAGAVGDDTLRDIARELVKTVRANVTIDWTIRENVRAHLRAIVKRVLRRYGYPPDKQEQATRTVLEQAELLCNEWAA